MAVGVVDVGGGEGYAEGLYRGLAGGHQGNAALSVNFAWFLNDDAVFRIFEFLSECGI